MKNWKTNFFGGLSLVLMAGSHRWPWMRDIAAMAIAAGLFSAKDSQVTGGTIPQNGGTTPAFGQGLGQGGVKP